MMARVHLLSASEICGRHGQFEVTGLRRSADRDRYGVHVLEDDPHEADIIIYAERENAAGATLERVRQHHVLREYPKKCFVFNPRYKGIPIVRGVYASIPKRWYDPERTRSSHYPEVKEDEIFFHHEDASEPDLLFSFAGTLWTHPVRDRLTTIASHPRGYVEDTSVNGISIRRVHEMTPEVKQYMQRYVDLIRRSKFVLCPRGTGSSSLRLFETMLLGRVPVILSDQWVPPEGPDWGAFSVRIRESDVASIPERLEEMEDNAKAMGLRARQTWETWFAEDVTFHRVVEWCAQLQRQSWVDESIMLYVTQLQRLRPSYVFSRHGGFVRRRFDALRKKIYLRRSI